MFGDVVRKEEREREREGKTFCWGKRQLCRRKKGTNGNFCSLFGPTIFSSLLKKDFLLSLFHSPSFKPLSKNSLLAMGDDGNWFPLILMYNLLIAAIPKNRGSL